MLRKLTILVVCALLAGCGSKTPTAMNEASDKNTERAAIFSVGETVEGLHVPVLLQAEGRNNLSIDQLRGSIVVLEFWATWCGPCIAAVGHLNEVADEFANKKNFRFISVTDEKLETVSKFLEQKPIHTWIGLDEQNSLLRAFEISGIPQTIIINAEGKVAAMISPTRLDAELLHRIQNGEIFEEKSSGSGIVAGVDPFGAENTQSVMHFILRETSTPSVEGSSIGSKTASTILGAKPEALIFQTFNLNRWRTDFKVDLPSKKYDLIMRFPESTESSKQLMKLAVASAFDIKTRQDVRLVDVFVLQTQENGQHTLSPTASTGGAFMNVNRSEINVVNGRLSNVLITLEARLKCPVVDETSLDGSYDFIVKFAENATPEEFAKAFTDATGLTLSRAKREIEFTVVEPASTAQ